MTEIFYIQDNNEKREATIKEKEQIEKDRKKWEAEQASIEVEFKAKEELRQSAIAKLAKLGLTEDEAKAIIGIQ